MKKSQISSALNMRKQYRAEIRELDKKRKRMDGRLKKFEKERAREVAVIERRFQREVSSLCKEARKIKERKEILTGRLS